MAKKQAHRDGHQLKSTALNEIADNLPEAAARRHRETFCKAVEIMANAMHDYIFNYPAVARHRDELGKVLGNVQTHLYPHVDRPKLVVNLADFASLEIAVPRSEGGALQTATNLEKARDRMLEGTVSVSDWADYCQEGRSLYNLAMVAHHLDRQASKENVFLADRFAVLALSRQDEKIKGDSPLDDLVAAAERQLSRYKDPWSRRPLSLSGLGRSGRLLHMDRQKSPRDDMIELEADLPEAVLISLRSAKNIALEKIIDTPGLTSCKLKARKVSATDSDARHIIHTDAWDKRKLHLLRPKPSRKPR